MNESKMSKSECERATDYTLPPLPDHPFERSQWSNRERMALEVWGQQCAEAARAPLLEGLERLGWPCRLAELPDYVAALHARIAELEAERDIDIRALLHVCRVYMASDEMPPEVQAKQALAAAERIRAQIRARRMKESGDA